MASKQVTRMPPSAPKNAVSPFRLNPATRKTVAAIMRTVMLTERNNGLNPFRYPGRSSFHMHRAEKKKETPAFTPDPTSEQKEEQDEHYGQYGKRTDTVAVDHLHAGRYSLGKCDDSVDRLTFPVDLVDLHFPEQMVYRLKYFSVIRSAVNTHGQ